MKKTNIIILLLSVFVLNLSAQDRTAYSLGGTSFGHEYNPAFQPICKVYVHLPALSKIEFNLRNSFGLYDVVQYNDVNNTSSGKKLDFDLLNSVLKDENSLTTRQSINLLGFGFKVKKLYFHMGASIVDDIRLSYPNDLLSLKEGFFNIEEDKPMLVDLSNIAANVNTYGEISLGASYADVIPGLTVGGKLKYLRGIVNLNTVNSTVKVSTDTNYHISANIDYSIQGAFPASVKIVDGKPEADITIEDLAGGIEYLKSANNSGFALDLGATYKFKEKFTFGLSILDLGTIAWKNQVNEMSAKFDYTFIGFDLSIDSLMAGNKDGNNSYIDREVKRTQDSIMDLLNNSIKTTDIESYNTALPTRIFLSANYQALKWLNVGILSRNEIYKGKFYTGGTLSVNVMPIRQVSASLSYSMFHNTYANVGAGLALRLGPVQFYTVTDNFISFLQPQNARNAYVRLGFNLMFGCKPKKEGQSLISQ